MRKDQNRIELQVRHGIYEEFTLDSDTTGNVLPGSLVVLSSEDGNPVVTASTNDLANSELAVVLENALVGKAMHAKQVPGESILCRRPVSGDTYLLRAVAGTYTSGQPLYATQTNDGVFVSASGEGKFVGWAQENYTVTNAMIGVIDDSTRDNPSTVNVNGLMANLVAVRIGTRPVSVNDSINYTVTANGDASTSSTALSIVFASAPATDLTAGEIAVTPTSVATTGALTKTDSTHYSLAITAVSDGDVAVVVTKTGVTTASKSATVNYVEPAGIDYTATPAEGTTTASIAIVFASAPESDLTAEEIAITPSSIATAGALTKTDSTNYTLAITAVSAGNASIVITKTGVESAAKTVAIAYPTSDIDYSVSANGDATTSSTAIAIVLDSAPATDLEAADIAVTPSSVATAGALTKTDSTHYSLAITAVSTGTATIAITKTGVVSTDKTASINYYVAPVGYWGVCYPDVRAGGGTTTPTAAEILALTTLNTITGTKQDTTCAFDLSETDWTAAGGSGTFATDGAGRAFFLTQDWGTAEGITSNSLSVVEAFDSFTLEINGVSYSGYIANSTPVVYDGTDYVFDFTA